MMVALANARRPARRPSQKGVRPKRSTTTNCNSADALRPSVLVTLVEAPEALGDALSQTYDAPDEGSSLPQTPSRRTCRIYLQRGSRRHCRLHANDAGLATLVGLGRLADPERLRVEGGVADTLQISRTVVALFLARSRAA